MSSKKNHIRTMLAATTLALAALGATPHNVFSADEATAAATVTIDGKRVAESVRNSLGDPSRFNWESVSVKSLDVSAGDIRIDVANLGDEPTARVRGGAIFTVRATGNGDRNSPLNIEFLLDGLDATIALAERKATVEVDLRVVNHESCRVWTRAKNQRTSPWSRMTFRVTAIPRPFDVRLKAAVDVGVKDDGTVALAVRSWRPVDPNDKIDIKISGQNLPDGGATIRPLDAEMVRVDMDLPFDAGDRTIGNPLRAAIGKVLGREFTIGSMPR